MWFDWKGCSVEKKKKKNLLDTTFLSFAGTDKVDVTNLVILVNWWKSYSEQINLIPAHYTIISNQLLPLNKKFLPIIIIFFILFFYNIFEINQICKQLYFVQDLMTRYIIFKKWGEKQWIK